MPFTFRLAIAGFIGPFRHRMIVAALGAFLPSGSTYTL